LKGSGAGINGLLINFKCVEDSLLRKLKELIRAERRAAYLTEGMHLWHIWDGRVMGSLIPKVAKIHSFMKGKWWQG